MINTALVSKITNDGSRKTYTFLNIFYIIMLVNRQKHEEPGGKSA
ncbi:MAG: hypothetical protein RHS_2482 [Robinsoniella sp. RHS]|nr:MAG: hypothetical protein RHS_2482 [Robinsoniella sp. RHS]